MQIYESILGDLGGAPTTGLLTATQYLKDNRLLPRGFDKATAAADIGVYGDAKRTRISSAEPIACATVFAARRRADRCTIEVELRYQPIAYRWAQNLERYDAPEPKRFLLYYSATADASSVVIATARARVE